MDSTRISPTAHYTGYVWYAHGLSHRALTTRTGRLLFRALVPLNRGLALVRAPTLEEMLLARHRALDALLERRIESGEVTQVVEIASGLSARGLRFMAKYGERGLRYVEADLPEMARRKRGKLTRTGLRRPGHEVAALDALVDFGPSSLHELSRTYLDPARGTAILTEGLVNYFDFETVRGMWQRFAACLREFPVGVYLTDLHLLEQGQTVGLRTFHRFLESFVRGPVQLSLGTEESVAQAAREVGFSEVSVATSDTHLGFVGGRRRASGRLVHIMTAEVRGGRRASGSR